jgi:NADH-quinone oxidoreductase subunit C
VEVAAAVAAAVPASAASGYESHGLAFVVVAPAAIRDVLCYLRDDAGHAYTALIDVTAVDRSPTEGVIEVVYVLRAPERRAKIVVKTKVPSDDPHLPTVTSLWKAADWAEREVYDMFGVRFDGHPNLKRILMYEPFDGYPLRKSYPYDKRQPLVAERDPIANPWPSRDRF